MGHGGGEEKMAGNGGAIPTRRNRLELAPFSYIAGYRMVSFFLESLA
jgi:hypothetical protein